MTSDFDPTAPAAYSVEQRLVSAATQTSNFTARGAPAIFYSVRTSPTLKSPWPEKTRIEDAQLRKEGHQVAVVKDIKTFREIYKKIVVALPERLFGCAYRPPAETGLPLDGYDYYAFSIPTSFMGDNKSRPKRLLMRVRLGLAGNETPSVPPVVCAFLPAADIREKTVEIGELRFDLWQAVKAFYPNVPDVVTARGGGKLEIHSMTAEVQATGFMQQSCEWRISDTKINYTMNPLVLAQVPAGHQLSIHAELNVEVEGDALGGLIRRAYAWSAEPRTYLLQQPEISMAQTVELSRPADSARTFRVNSIGDATRLSPVIDVPVEPMREWRHGDDQAHTDLGLDSTQLASIASLYRGADSSSAAGPSSEHRDDVNLDAVYFGLRSISSEDFRALLSRVSALEQQLADVVKRFEEASEKRSREQLSDDK